MSKRRRSFPTRTCWNTSAQKMKKTCSISGNNLRRRVPVLVVALCACALSTALAAWSAAPRQKPQPDSAALRSAAQSTEWLTYGGSYAETRFSPLRQINASNVERLGLAWTYVVGSGGGNQEA